MSLRRVVVTGLGALTPIGNTVDEYWDGLMKAQSGAGPITRFDTTNFKTKFACEVKGFDAADYFDRKELRKMDLFQQYSIVTSDQAIKDSGLDLEKEDKDRIGVIWGSGIGGIKTFQDEVSAYIKGDGTPRFSPFFIVKMIVDLSSGYISIRNGFRGPNFSTVSACATSLHAIIDSYNYIRLGYSDVMITGGSEAAVVESSIGGFNSNKALSERNDDPATASRPYDKDRDGFVLGEGGGGLVLEEYERAKARGAKIYGEVIGAGLTADAYHITAPDPEGRGIRNVMTMALNDAGIAKEEVEYINTHGTSTPLGDVGELKAIEAVYGDHIYNMNISATKSMTGHLLGAAGAIETIACLKAMEHGKVPPTINHFTDDENIDPKLNLTFGQPQARQLSCVMNNGFGFGGHNASLIFRKV